jgi:hypothetical protein
MAFTFVIGNARAPRPPPATSEAREPPTSTVPTVSDTVPSGAMLSVGATVSTAEVEPEAAGDAASLVRPERAPTGARCAFAACRVSTNADLARTSAP